MSGSYRSITDTAVVDTPAIVINADERLNILLDNYKSANKTKKTIHGYRIQIAASNDRNKVYKLKGQFYNNYQDIKSYVHYQQPNFKLKVGNYRTKLEAQKVLLEINTYYRDAFIVYEEIPLKEFLPKE